MTEFTLRLKIPNAGNKEIYYSVNLTGPDVSHPEDYFSARTDRGNANRLNLRQAIENQSLRQVTDEQLERIINEWNYGIKNGKSNSTTITISLDACGGSNNSVPGASSYSNTSPPVARSQTVLRPPVDNRPPVTTGEKQSVSPPVKQRQPPISTTGEQKIKGPDLENNSPSDSQDATPAVETWTTDNQADF